MQMNKIGVRHADNLGPVATARQANCRLRGRLDDLLWDIVRETAFAVHCYHKNGHPEKVYENALAGGAALV